MASKAKGFTLIEIIIVVAIIAVIAGIAIPMAVRSRLSANEAAAIASLRTLAAAQETFKSGSGLDRYATLTELGSAHPAYIDAALASGKISGYNLTLGSVAFETWSATALPVQLGKSGKRSFFIDQTQAITFTPDGAIPTAASPVLNAKGAAPKKVAKPVKPKKKKNKVKKPKKPKKKKKVKKPKKPKKKAKKGKKPKRPIAIP